MLRNTVRHNPLTCHQSTHTFYTPRFLNHKNTRYKRYRQRNTISSMKETGMMLDGMFQHDHSIIKRFYRSTIISYSDISTRHKLNVTDSAKKRLVSVLKGEPKGTYLRIAVSAGGCNGYKVEFELDTETLTRDDILVHQEGDSMLITDKMSLLLVDGSTIDYVNELARSSFSITENPNASKSCGCDMSFSV
eukprot:TRINITY_DN2286_c0_g2_i1.p1 TRINITY_DN2286_c0_g2~~TRINITY_DN2286_c0_g2_i1.p1  ORF type:complete len:191 (-),score=31.91 TRINITY_DN2286_c0_g2_i1:59-631(-)